MSSFVVEVALRSDAQFEEATARAHRDYPDFLGSAQVRENRGEFILDSVHPQMTPSTGPQKSQFYFQSQASAEAFKSTFSQAHLYEQPESDWMSEWRKHFRGVVVSRFFVAPEGEFCPKDLLPIWIEPGMGFGTGTHETTQLCLEALSERVSPEARVLDFGAGSGVLAIGAARLGAMAVDAVEVDEDALQNARTNLRLNQMESIISLTKEIPRSSSGYDVILANILEPVLLSYADELLEVLTPGGVLVLSGLLRDQSERVKTRYIESCRRRWDERPRVRVTEKNEWRCLQFEMPK